MGVRSAVTAIAVALTVAAVAGCGLGPGPGTSNVSLKVTRNFGTRSVGSVIKPRVPGSETVMRMLERSFSVGTRYGGGFVESIDGHSGSSNRLDWFYYVNGVQASVGAAQTAVHKGDRIWWDLHDWSATDSIPAVVGSFPEPFAHGTGGRRLPTVIECSSDVSSACNRVSAELHSVGVPVASQAPGTGSGTDSLSVLIGTWKDVRSSVAAALLQQGPSASGVYAEFASGGAALELLDPRGHVIRTLGRGAGLVAATSDSSAEPTWIISGTDPAGVSAAAAAVTPGGLDDHFAVAVAGGSELPVPLDGAS
jgi:hypothetical protein